jgi:hypothetical protein
MYSIPEKNDGDISSRCCKFLQWNAVEKDSLPYHSPIVSTKQKTKNNLSEINKIVKEIIKDKN